MKKKQILIVALLAVLILIIVGVAFCSKKEEKVSDMTENETGYDIVIEEDDDSKANEGIEEQTNQDATPSKDDTKDSDVKKENVKNLDDVISGSGDTTENQIGNEEDTEDNDEEETPSTELQPSEDKGGSWGKVEF